MVSKIGGNLNLRFSSTGIFVKFYNGSFNKMKRWTIQSMRAVQYQMQSFPEPESERVRRNMDSLLGALTLEIMLTKALFEGNNPYAGDE